MPQFDTPVLVGSFLEFGSAPAAGVAPGGNARLWFDAQNGVLKLSVSGGAYTSLQAVPNAGLGAPKVVAYQETIPYASFTDGGGASGTYALATTIPAGAVYLQSLCTALTGFSGNVSAVAILGDGSDTDRYNTGTPDFFTTAAAGVSLGAPSGTAFHSVAKTPTLTITKSTDWGTGTAGSVAITMFWYQAS